MFSVLKNLPSISKHLIKCEKIAASTKQINFIKEFSSKQKHLRLV